MIQSPFLFSDIEGSLVWTALSVSIGGLIISWFVGYRLPGLEYNNQKVEAAFRKDLVLGEDDKVNYAQTDTLWYLFAGIRFNYQRLYLHYGYFDIWIEKVMGNLWLLFLFLIIGPSLFTGAALLGVVIQISNAFDRVHSGFLFCLIGLPLLS